MPQPSRILIVLSYYLSHKWTMDFYATIRSAFKNEVIFSLIELDAMRDFQPEKWQNLIKEEIPRLSSRHYDLVLTVGDEATELMLRNAGAFPKTPLVFAGYFNDEKDLKKKNPNVTGVTMKYEIRKTIDAAMKLLPKTQTVLVLSDGTPQGDRLKDFYRKKLADFYQADVTYLDMENQSWQAFWQTIRDLPPDHFIVLSFWRVLRENYQTLAGFGMDLNLSSPHPFFVMTDSLLEQGAAAGGYVTSGVTHAKETIQQIRRVMQRKSAFSIPVVSGSTEPIFDLNIIHQYRLDPKRLPENAKILNKPKSFWDVWRGGILFFAEPVLPLVLSGIVFGLSFFLWRRKLRRRNEAVYRALPGRIGACTIQERLLFLHDPSTSPGERKFEYVHDIPDIDYRKSSEAIALAFQTKRQVTIEYDYRGTARAMMVAPLSRELFGEDAVVWFSYDNSKLQNARREAAAYAERLKAEQELWQNIADAMPVIFFVKDTADHYRYILTNRELENFVHAEPGSLNGKTDDAIFSRSEAEQILRKDREILTAGKTMKFQEILTDSDGTEHHLQTIKKPYLSRNGRMLLLGLSVDVTELNAAIASEKVLNFCLETLIRENDTKKSIFMVLEAVCRYIGASRSYIFQFNTDAKTISSYIEYAPPGHEPVFSDVRDRSYSVVPDWEERFVQNKSIRIPDLRNNVECEGLAAGWGEIIKRCDMRSFYATRIMLNSKFWGYIGMIYEGEMRNLNGREMNFICAVAHFIELMLQRRETQEQVMGALRQARAADKAKSFFIASVSHEIRTPLNAIIGFSELLKERRVEPELQNEYVDAIAFSGSALLQLINDVLDLSKLEADQMTIKTEPTDFAALGAEVMKVFSHRAQERRNKLIVDIREMPVLELDKLRVRQILFNLIGNAVKFTENGTVTLWAEFRKYPASEGTLRMGVTDTGVGIVKDDQSKLMQPFVQLSRMRGTNATNNGTGLGLVISKRLAEKMGGHLWLKSEIGKGSTFGVILRHVKLIESPDEAVGQVQITGEKGFIASKPSILLVDDVVLNLKVLEAICHRSGVRRVEAVSSGAAALRVLEKCRFDLVLTDMWMPEMNGQELVETIRRNPGNLDIRVVAITADTDSQSNFDMSLFDDVIQKPVTLEHIQNLLRRFPLR